MRYGIMAYAVSLNKLENALGKSNAKRGLLGRLFGSSTGSLVEKIKQKSAYRFEQDDEDEEDEAHTLTLQQALVDLLDGNEFHSIQHMVTNMATPWNYFAITLASVWIARLGMRCESIGPMKCKKKWSRQELTNWRSWILR